MKALLALLIAFPAVSFAAPWGHQICKGKVDGKRIQLIFGTYAMTGDAELKVDGRKYEFDVDSEPNPDGPGLWLGAAGTAGAIGWVSVGDSPDQITLTLKLVDGVKFENKVFRCRVLDFHMGQEQM